MFEGIELLNDLSAEDKNNLTLFCQERILEEGEVLFQEGDESNSMYIVQSGLLQAYTSEKVLGNIGAGELVGEMAIFNEPQNRMASVKAVKETQLIVIISYSIEQLIKKHPSIVQKIQTIIKKRQQENQK